MLYLNMRERYGSLTPGFDGGYLENLVRDISEAAARSPGRAFRMLHKAGAGGP
jgi:hypothetical protein